ncbi:MAG: hypothetical protein WC378_06380 [Opitutaceae bacterium]|jgi:hypothetical protein
MSLSSSHPFRLWTPTSDVRSPISWLFILALAASACAVPIETSAPVKKFSLPTFTPEGPRSMLLRGEEARFKTSQEIDITEMQLTLFDGKPDEKVDTVFVSTAATFFPSRQVAKGVKGVRIIRPEVEMYGERWIYEHQRKKVVIDGKVRVIFRAQLKDILK